MSMTYETRVAWQNRVLLAPAFVLLACFILLPAGAAIYVSFTNDALSGFAAAHPQFVGLKNYVRLFSDDGFWNSLVVTFFFVFGSSVVGQFVLGLASAMALSRPIAFRSVFNAALLLPNAVPEVVEAVSQLGTPEIEKPTEPVVELSRYWNADGENGPPGIPDAPMLPIKRRRERKVMVQFSATVARAQPQSARKALRSSGNSSRLLRQSRRTSGNSPFHPSPHRTPPRGGAEVGHGQRPDGCIRCLPRLASTT
jgi:hypothetical protein